MDGHGRPHPLAPEHPVRGSAQSISGEALINGLGLAVAHKGSGWIGDRLMHPRYRSQELEGELLAALLQNLEAKQCTTQFALVADASVPVFSAQGFVPEGHYVTYGGGQSEVPLLDEVELCEWRHWPGILRLDALASGEDRSELVSEHFHASRIFMNQGRVLGHYMVLLGEGLIVAQSAYAGEELLRWHLPHVEEVTLPEANRQAIDFLQRRKYTERRRVLRMRRGPALPWHPEMLWGRIGNNLG